MRIRPPFVAEYESTVLGLRTSTFFQVALCAAAPAESQPFLSLQDSD